MGCRFCLRPKQAYRPKRLGQIANSFPSLLNKLFKKLIALINNAYKFMVNEARMVLGYTKKTKAVSSKAKEPTQLRTVPFIPMKATAKPTSTPSPPTSAPIPTCLQKLQVNVLPLKRRDTRTMEPSGRIFRRTIALKGQGKTPTDTYPVMAMLPPSTPKRHTSMTLTVTIALSFLLGFGWCAIDTKSPNACDCDKP